MRGATVAGRPRVNWNDVKGTISLAEVAARALGLAPGRHGASGRRLWWHCPFHEDANPSFCIELGGRQWRCWGCGAKGDVIELVRRLNPGWTFPEAVVYLSGSAATSRNPGRPTPPVAKATASHVKRSSGLAMADALRLVEEAAERLWTHEGADSLAYLKGRGLTEAAIRASRLGWTPGASVPIKDGTRFWNVSGITIPWMDGNRLSMVKIRRPLGSEPKYAEAFRDGPAIYPSPSAVQPGKPLVIVEGEFDALLLGQELADLAAVVTLGSASSRPEGSTYLAMFAAPLWYVAHDADDAGDKAASGWPARARRVRPPSPYKDWTDVHAAGFNMLRYVWCGVLKRPGTSSDELVSQRWGPAIDDPNPGIITDRAGQDRMLASFGPDPDEQPADEEVHPLSAEAELVPF